MREERGVDKTNGLKEDMVLGCRRVGGEGFVEGGLRIVEELARAHSKISSGVYKKGT